MNKGTKEGTEEEVLLTKRLNKKDDKELWSILNLSSENNFAIHVISKKYGKINQEKVSSKADVFIVNGAVDKEYLLSKDFYLNENDATNFNLKPLSETGISVKRPDSDKYQIIKISPNTFLKVFGSNLLAAGASIYCTKPEEFIKNIDVLKGWNVNEEEFLSFFSDRIMNSIKSTTDINNKELLGEIKKYSNKAIKEVICANNKISEFIFLGKGNFDEPYTATWLFEKGIFKKNFIIPFEVTTGSGRSKGDFTIVIKPS